MSKTTELAIVLPQLDAALPFYSKEGGLDEFIKQVRQQVSGVAHDVTTRKGREAIASDAYKVAQSKMAIEKLGKEVSAVQKELPKKIDAERKRAFDELEKLQAETRKPLTDWEAAEAARAAKHQKAIKVLGEIVLDNKSADEIAAMIQALEATKITKDFEEFETEAHRAKADALTQLQAAHEKQAKYETDQAELLRLKAEMAERERKEADERIAREAAEVARREAEAAAQAEREAAAKREADAKAAQAKAEQDKIDAQNALKAAEEKAERDRLAAIEAKQKAERDAENERIASEQRAAQAAEQARLAEIKRQQDEQARIEREAKAREADKNHRRAINAAALSALVAGGISEDCAKTVITLIARGKIPAITITY